MMRLGGGIKYDFGKKSGTSAVKITGGKIKFPVTASSIIIRATTTSTKAIAQ